MSLMPYFLDPGVFADGEGLACRSEGANAELFMATISEPNQDRLESDGGACIMYTRYTKRFCENGVKCETECRLMERLREKNG